jgi:hypothetical protein
VPLYYDKPEVWLPAVAITQQTSRLPTFPGEKQMQRLIASGEGCTWPKLEMIRLQTRISRTLDGIRRQYESLQ